MIRSNFHTHTTYCDGACPPEAMAEAARALGFAALGFSGHAWTPWDGGYGTPPGRLAAYAEDVRGLARRHAGAMRVFLGLEQEALALRQAP